MGKIDNIFKNDLEREEQNGKEEVQVGKLRKFEKGRTEIMIDEIEEIREVIYKFTDKVTRKTKPVVRKIYVFRNEFKSGVPLIVPLSVHKEIRSLRIKHGQRMVQAIVKASGDGIARKYQVNAELRE